MATVFVVDDVTTNRDMVSAVLYLSGYAGPALDEVGGLGPDVTMLFRPFEPAGLPAAVRPALRVDDRP